MSELATTRKPAQAGAAAPASAHRPSKTQDVQRQAPPADGTNLTLIREVQLDYDKILRAARDGVYIHMIAASKQQKIAPAALVPKPDPQAQRPQPRQLIRLSDKERKRNAVECMGIPVPRKLERSPLSDTHKRQVLEAAKTMADDPAAVHMLTGIPTALAKHFINEDYRDAVARAAEKLVFGGLILAQVSKRLGHDCIVLSRWMKLLASSRKAKDRERHRADGRNQKKDSHS